MASLTFLLEIILDFIKFAKSLLIRKLSYLKKMTG